MDAPRPDLRQDWQAYIIGIAAIASISFGGWVAVTLVDVKSDLAVIATDLRHATDDRYRRSDAARDFEYRDRRQLDMERRIERLESRNGQGVSP